MIVLTRLYWGLGAVAPACNPSSLGGQGRWITWGQEFKTSLPQHVEISSPLKYKNQLGVVAGHLSFQLLGRLRQENHLNPGGGVCSELRLCHCTPAWATEPGSISKKQNKSKNPKPVSLLALLGWCSRRPHREQQKLQSNPCYGACGNWRRSLT